MAKAQVESVQHAVIAAEGRFRAADAVQKRTERGFRKEDIASAHADVTLAQGELDEAEARYAEREVRVPTAVVVEAMDIRPGDLLPPNAPLGQGSRSGPALRDGLCSADGNRQSSHRRQS